MSSSRIVAFAAILLFAAAGFYLSQRLLRIPNAAPLETQTLDPEQRVPLLPPGEAVRAEVAAPAPAPASAARLRKEKNVIPNERVLRFRSVGEMKQFITRASARGITILAELEAFNAVRIGVKTDAELEGLLGEGEAELSFNHFVRTPKGRTSESKPQPDAVPFANQALRWLGVSEAHPEWGKGITVAVLDTGLDPRSGMTGTSLDLLGDSVKNGSEQGHGTAVSSIIAGGGDRAGMAPAVDLLNIQVMGGDGVGDSFTLARGISEAMQRGASIINLSLGSSSDDPLLKQVVDQALARGILIVASAGNDGFEELSYPARYPGVIAVTSVDALGQRMNFANQGPELTIAAPGFGVNATWSGGQVVGFSGTSASAPFVSGALAALLSTTPNPSTAQALQQLTAYADEAGVPGRDSQYGNGILNVGRVMNHESRGIYDVAIAGFFIRASPPSANPFLVVVVQNRGTETALQVEVHFTVEAYSQTFFFQNLAPGQSVGPEMPMNTALMQWNGPLKVKASVSLVGATDAHPANNAMEGTVSLRSPAR